MCSLVFVCGEILSVIVWVCMLQYCDIVALNNRGHTGGALPIILCADGAFLAQHALSRSTCMLIHTSGVSETR